MDYFISIIIPTFNRAGLITETLGSLTAQTFQDWECIVVDDGSTDQTIDVVTAFAKAEQRIKLLQRPSNKPKGANACRNYGLSQATGNCVLFYDSDDVMLPEKLQWHVDGFEKTPMADGFILNSYYYNFETKNPYLPWRERLYTDHMLQDYILQNAGWQTGDVLWKRNSLKDLSFNELLQSSQDFEFYARALILQKNFAFQDIRASHIRHTPGSIKIKSSITKIQSDLKSRELITHLLFKKRMMTRSMAQKLIKEHYSFIEFLAFKGVIKKLSKPLLSLYNLSSFLKQRTTFFNKILIVYPFKVLKKVFS